MYTSRQDARCTAMSDPDFKQPGAEFGILQRGPHDSFTYEAWETMKARMQWHYMSFMQPVFWERWKHCFWFIWIRLPLWWP
jgi:hypothetical protein